jgi:ADP-ribose pyrophosphatase YjhB (NUDIX family)
MSRAIPINYCTQCGESVSLKTPADDDRARHICDACGYIHYQNPKVVNGAIVEWENRILLCKRAIEPRYGYWTLPAGFMENGETTYQGAIRETWEEARANIEIEGLYLTANLPHINQIYMLFKAKLKNVDFGPGPESLEVTLFDEEDIPWNELAFPVIKTGLELYLENRREGHFPFRMIDIVRHDDTNQTLEVSVIK